MKRFFLLSYFCFISIFSFSQSEIGGSLGGSLFKGDVNRFFAFKETKPAIGLFFRQHLTHWFSVRANFNFTTVSGSDKRNESFTDKDINFKLRNLHFRSRIVELNLLFEFFLPSIKSRKSSPFIFLGGGFFYFNPQAKYKGKWYDLQPLGTEGQGLNPLNPKYERFQKNVISGLGFKYKLSARYCLSFEIGLRWTFTDYIDDVSGIYYDKGSLYQKNSPLAAIFSDRSGELISDNSYSNAINVQGGYVVDPYSESGYRIKGYGNYGDVRGDAEHNDKYLIYSFSFSSRLGKLE